MSLLSRLFGGKASAEAPKPEIYKDFAIFAEPIAEGQTYRLCARIVGTIDGQEKEHRVIRADTLNNEDDAIAASLAKAKQMIDEQGARLFT